MSFESLRKVRENLINLISEDASANKFLAELLKAQEFLNKLPENLTLMARVWARGASEYALSEVRALDEKTRAKHRAYLLEYVAKLVLEIEKILKAQQVEFPSIKVKREEYAEIINEQRVKDCFIERGPLKGIWLYEVPVNLLEIEKTAREFRKRGSSWGISLEKLENSLAGLAKYVDLVCIEAPETKIITERQKVTDYLAARRLNEPVFNGRTVFLIEAKASDEGLPKAINQILEYKRLFQQDWPKCTIKGVGIICASWNPKAIAECKKHKIQAWEVTCKEVIGLN